MKFSYFGFPPSLSRHFDFFCRNKIILNVACHSLFTMSFFSHIFLPMIDFLNAFSLVPFGKEVAVKSGKGKATSQMPCRFWIISV
ncbi:hypothetical protein CW304_18045 [Bacillus sp. UFRGS-B20]|nr:hypothetical protein CW304_18045 [Bacillus sp. UFRGS-B20]